MPDNVFYVFPLQHNPKHREPPKLSLDLRIVRVESTYLFFIGINYGAHFRPSNKLGLLFFIEASVELLDANASFFGHLVSYLLQSDAAMLCYLIIKEKSKLRKTDRGRVEYC